MAYLVVGHIYDSYNLNLFFGCATSLEVGVKVKPSIPLLDLMEEEYPMALLNLEVFLSNFLFLTQLALGISNIFDCILFILSMHQKRSDNSSFLVFALMNFQVITPIMF